MNTGGEVPFQVGIKDLRSGHVDVVLDTLELEVLLRRA